MRVDVDEDTFRHTDEDSDSEINFKEGNDTLPDLEQDSEQSSEMGYNNDSVKMANHRGGSGKANGRNRQ